MEVRWTQFGNLKNRYTVFPRWGVPLLLVAALPGIAVAIVAGLLLVTSLLILVVLVVPVYRVLQLAGGRKAATVEGPSEYASPEYASPGSKPVEVRILDT